MIEQKTMTAVAYTKLDQAKVLILPYADTPLELILKDINVSALVTSKTEDLPDDHAPAVDYVNSLDSHTEAMAELRVLGVQGVRHLSDLVKNTINPHIRRVAEMVENYGADAEPPFQSWSVSGLTLSEFIVSQPAERLLASFRDANTYEGKAPEGGIGEVDHDYIKTAALFTDTDGYNDRVKQLLSSDENLYLVRSMVMGESQFKNIDPELALVALAVLTATKTPPVNTRISLDQWEVNRLQLMNKTAKIVLAVIQRYEYAIKTNTLYTLDVLKQPGTIYVNDKVYRNLIEKGLTPEIVMGNETMGRRFMTYQLLEPEVSAACTRAYTLHRQSQEAAARLDEKTYRIKAIQDSLRTDLNRIADSEEWPVDGDDRDKAWTRLRVIVDKIMSGPNKDANTDDIIAAVLLGTWYAHTDAWRLIDIALRIGKEDPELTPDEVFTLSKIEYVGQWIATQLHIRGNIDDSRDEDRVVPVAQVG